MDDYGYGDFNYRTVVSGFVNDLSRMRPDAVHFGLEQQIEYVYGFFTAADGTITCLEQKFVGSVSTGTFVMRTDGRGGMNVQPETTRSYRGEVRRTIDDKYRKWSDPVMLRLPASARRDEDLPYLLELDGDKFVWDQGLLCHLEGEIKTLGVQFYSASAVEPLFFTSIPYWVHGEVLGRPTSGLVYFDRVHLKPGTEWKETKMFTDVQLSWNIFGNRYADGSIEAGGQNLPGNWESNAFNLPAVLHEAIPEIDERETTIVMHNDAVVQGLSEAPFMHDVETWAAFTIGTGLGNALYENRKQ